MLVQASGDDLENGPGEYLVVDESVLVGQGKNGAAEPRHYIARLVIEGKPMQTPMSLPKRDDLAKYRLSSIKDDEPKAKRTITYGMNVDPNTPKGTLFQIDQGDRQGFRSYDESNVLTLTLNKTEEWILAAKNGITAQVTHPFHIHINPFEVISITADDDTSQPKKNLLNYPPPPLQLRGALDHPPPTPSWAGPTGRSGATRLPSGRARR